MKEKIIEELSLAIVNSGKRNQILANQLGMSENRVSEMKNKKNVEISMEKAMETYKKLGGNIEIKMYRPSGKTTALPADIARLVGLNMIWRELKNTIPGHMEVENNAEKNEYAENFLMDVPKNDINVDEAAKIAVNVMLEATQFSKFSEGELIEKLIEAALEHAMMRNSIIVNKIEEILEGASQGSDGS
jgi:predicted XRE-type DNA-binding protein